LQQSLALRPDGVKLSRSLGQALGRVGRELPDGLDLAERQGVGDQRSQRQGTPLVDVVEGLAADIIDERLHWGAIGDDEPVAVELQVVVVELSRRINRYRDRRSVDERPSVREQTVDQDGVILRDAEVGRRNPVREGACANDDRHRIRTREHCDRRS
jgi:hypothetical protein